MLPWTNPRPFLTALVVAGVCVSAFARGPEPAVRIPLEELGYLAPPARAMLSGDATSTVNFIDPTHLLLTYTTRSLLTRLPDDPPTDEDRNVAAVLLELPSGKVLARTEWRTHDHRTYIWALPHGRFVLRLRKELFLLAPLANLQAGGSAFQPTRFLRTQGDIGFLSFSPSGDLMTLQTFVPDTADTGPSGSLPAGDVALAQQEVQVNFYRLRERTPTTSAPAGAPTLYPVAAGVLRAAGLLALPVISEGYLDAVQESDRAWDFDFYTHAGKKQELAGVDSTCVPRPVFVSSSEFISFNCRGTGDRVSLDGLNMSGDHLWTKSLASGVRLPFISTAPAAGRYALSRLLYTTTPSDLSNITPDQISGQEITVTQMWSGQDLFRTTVTPMQRDGQNFDLSPDGISLAIIRDGNIEIYPLPALTGKDREQIGLAQHTAPEPTDVAIRLNTRAAPPAVPKQSAITIDPDHLPTLTPAPTLAAPESTPPPRPKPTLYGPGEIPQKN